MCVLAAKTESEMASDAVPIEPPPGFENEKRQPPIWQQQPPPCLNIPNAPITSRGIGYTVDNWSFIIKSLKKRKNRSKRYKKISN